MPLGFVLHAGGTGGDSGCAPSPAWLKDRGCHCGVCREVVLPCLPSEQSGSFPGCDIVVLPAALTLRALEVFSFSLPVHS